MYVIRITTNKVKVQVKLSPMHAMKLYGEWTAALILNRGTRWDEWSASRSIQFVIGEEAPPGNHRITDWVNSELV
jgi:hypothetical protein